MNGVFVTFIGWSVAGWFICLCLKERIASFRVSFMKTPVEHYLDDLCLVLQFTSWNCQEPGCHVI